jgi:hypothetical protein
MRWSDEEFRRLRELADPAIDEEVAAYRRAHPELGDPLTLMRSLIRELAEAEERARGFSPEPAKSNLGLLDALGSKTSSPEWGRDSSLLEKGQAVFTNYGLYQAVGLFFASLPMGYALVPSAKVLYAISDLANRDGKLTRRVGETGQMLIDVMGVRGPGGLERGGPGHTTAIGVRLLHSFVRALMLERDGAEEWNAGAYGPPANQELLLATLFDFSVVIWSAMERMGVTLSDEDKAANLYTWSVFGHLMGLDVCRDQPLRLADVDPVCTHLGARLESSYEGRRLMRALLVEMEEFMFLGWRKLPRSLIRWLFVDAPYGTDRVPDLLGVPKAAWWAKPLFLTARAAQRFERRRDPLRPLVRLLMRKAGRFVVCTYADQYSGGQAPFRIPDELARAWRVRQTPVARRARRVRRQTRRAVRSSLRPLRRETEERNAKWLHLRREP